MKKILTLLLTLMTILIYGQNQLVVEADVPSGSDRTLMLAHNMNNGSKGLTGIQLLSGTGVSQTTGVFINYNDNYTAIPDFNGYVSILSGSTTQEGRGINLIGQKDYANIRFYLGGVTSSDMKMILDSDGELGIGTTTPASKLHISDGDIYIEDVNNGVIMKSPNGNCWRMTIDNNGIVQTTALLSCP